MVNMILGIIIGIMFTVLIFLIAGTYLILKKGIDDIKTALEYLVNREEDKEFKENAIKQLFKVEKN